MNLRLTLPASHRKLAAGESLVIGRDAASDLGIEHPGVGRPHAEIYHVPGGWWVRDLGSDTGTYLNGEIVEAAPLEAPAEIRLGEDGPAIQLDPDAECL